MVAVDLQRYLPDRCPLRSNAAECSVQGQLVGHFGLRENPFGVTPDPRFLFLSQTHREALASLVNGIDCDFGFQVLVAQPGMGKTTLLFNFLERFRTTAHTAFLFQPQPNPCELLQSVLFELGTSSEETSMRKLSEQLNQVLTRAAGEQKRVIVVLDEAQNLDFSVLEALRQLSNFETASAKLMQIVLAGQPQLAKRLALPEQEQLMQRISAFGRLSPLALNETQAYITHRLATAGYQGARLFTLGAIRNIWDYSRGVPRNINTLCFSAMLLGFAEHARSIDERIVDEAARDLNLDSVLADVYQMNTSGSAMGGNRKLQLVSETPVAESPVAPVVASAASSSEGNSSSAGQSVPSAPVAVQAPAAAEPIVAVPVVAVEPQITKAEVNATAIEAPVSPGKASLPAVATTIQKSPATTPNSRITTPAKITPPKVAKQPVRPAPVTAVAMAPPAIHRVAEKRSDSRAWWGKALVLTAITGILAFVLGQEFSSQRPGQVEANGAGGTASAQSGSAPGYSANESQGSSQNTPGAQSKNSSAARGASNADSNDDVTVRKFPTDPDVGSESSGKGRKLETIFFDQDSAIIDAQYGPFLHRIAEALAENPGASVILEGHTDNTGPETYNLDLSSRRAIAVRNALVDELRVSTTRLAAIGAGAAAPVQPNSSAEGRAYNRRVEVRLVHLSE